MMLESLLSRYGYLALVGGTFVEGETFIVLAGFLAHRGYFSFPVVLTLAAVGAFAGDVLYFALGRHYGRQAILRRKGAAAMVPRLEELMHRHHILFLFGVRYVWGFRWAGASLAGASKLSFRRFAAIDLAACALWSVVMGTAGYLAGEAMEQLIADVKTYEPFAIVTLVLAGLVYAFVLHRRTRTIESGVPRPTPRALP